MNNCPIDFLNYCIIYLISKMTHYCIYIDVFCVIIKLTFKTTIIIADLILKVL